MKEIWWWIIAIVVSIIICILELNFLKFSG